MGYGRDAPVAFIMKQFDIISRVLLPLFIYGVRGVGLFDRSSGRCGGVNCCRGYRFQAQRRGRYESGMCWIWW